MASLAEHLAKTHAYMRCYTWNNHADSQQTCVFFSKGKYESHVGYVEKMKKSKSYWYGTPPRSRFLNWLGHKLLELAWGERFI